MFRYLIFVFLFVATPVHASVEDAAERSRAAVGAVMAQYTMPAVSLAVGIGGEIVYAEAHGFASLSDSVPATPETKFGIGSITKSLTLALVARLVEKGQLDWDGPIEAWIGDFRFERAGMSLRHIGAHQSGLNDDAVNELRLTLSSFSSFEAYELSVQSPLDFPPGRNTRYSTGSFNVMALSIEAVTGKSFASTLEKEILSRAGMSSTLPNDPQRKIEDRTRFYELQKRGLRPVIFDPSCKLAGAGYLSTPSDLVRFGMALIGGELIGSEQLAVLLAEQQTAAGTSAGYALGWQIAEDDGQVVYHQPGGGPGISSYLVIYPERELVFAVVCNETSGPVGGKIMEDTLAAFLELTE